MNIYKNASGDKYSWEDYGTIQPHLVGCLAGSWVLICLSLIKGIQSYGKVAYVITMSPFVVLTILLSKHILLHALPKFLLKKAPFRIVYAIAGLDGAGDGVEYLFNPDWDKLTDPTIWAKGASQILFSLSVAFGSQLVLSSYNNFKNNTHRDSLVVGVCNSLTSLYAGIVVFLILGFLAKSTNSGVEDVVNDGITLAFVSYASAGASIMSILCERSFLILFFSFQFWKWSLHNYGHSCSFSC